jgi:CHAT domain-containing protein
LYPTAAALEDVQAELEPQDALVIYSLVAEEALALVVTKGAARTVSLGPRESVAAAASTRPEDPDSDFAAPAAALRSKLVEPLGLPEGTGRLLIAPDGVLGFTPFSLLVPETEIVYVPSGTAYRVLRGSRRENGRGVLALGDPDYSTAPGSASEVASRAGVGLVPLPATRQEAEGIGDVVLLGKEATKSALLSALQKRERWEAVHLACHAWVDPSRPTRSALALAFDESGSNLLLCEEVFTLRVPADLTVLSACETGRGAVYRSEGIVGLAQAFMLAGSPRVLVSLWKVDDRATRSLMLEFYRAWRPEGGEPGLTAAAALKRAQAHVRSQEKWKHPYYWAAWVLWGLPD